MKAEEALKFIDRLEKTDDTLVNKQNIIKRLSDL